MKRKSLILTLLQISLILYGCAERAPVSPNFSEVVETQDNPGMSQFSRLDRDSDGIGVMTWNIYVGTDVNIVLAAQNPQDIPILAAQAFQQLLQTNFPERAQAIARQVARFRPHLIGLQEVSLIRMQSPGDAVIGGTIPAKNVVFDYLDILLDVLRTRGLHYHVAGKVQNADVEVPIVVNPDPLQFDDVRLTDFDVVLARTDVEISNTTAKNYNRSLVIPELGIKVPRGYVAVDATVNGRDYKFVNTHLEPASSGESIQLAQVKELLADLEGTTLPVIMVGDFNTRPPDDNTYKTIVSEHFTDSWPLNHIKDNPHGFTSPHDADLLNKTVNFFQRIDFIFVRAREVGVVAEVVGDEKRDRTPSGLWPSDHGGVVAKLKVMVSEHMALK